MGDGDAMNTEPGLSADKIIAEINSVLRQETTLEYGVPYLDDDLLGMSPNELILIGARSGGGKTELATQILITQQKRCKPVMYYALDHERSEIERRVLWRRIVGKIRQDRPPEFRGVYLRYAEWRAG